MFRNQYLASNLDNKNNFGNFKQIKIGELTFYLHNSLLYQFIKENDIEILVIGYIFNPLEYNKFDKNLISELAIKCKTKEEFFQEIQLLSGRFVIIYKNSFSFIVCGDAVHFRQIYYSFDNYITITSNVKMFLEYYDYNLKICSEKELFIRQKQFKEREHAWYGDGSLDDRVYKLLPNHYLDLNKKAAFRLPYYVNDDLRSESDYISFSADILRGTYNYLSKKFFLLQPLTSGLDSRILLAASKDHKKNIHYYLFNKDSNPFKSDNIISKKLSKKLNFHFTIYDREKLNDEFVDLFVNEHIKPRLLSKTANIQHHFYNSTKKINTLSVSGVVGEVVRCFYGYTSNRNITPKLLYELSGYAGTSEYVYNEISKWLDGVKTYANQNNLSILDLFYWEQRLGNWGALYPFEQDIAIEENSPFNNRALLMNLHRISYKKRRAPNYEFFQKLLSHLWGDVLSEPINPDRKKIIDMLKERALIRYYVLKTKRFLNR